MKVLLVAELFGSALLARAFRAEKLVKYLRRRGHDLTVVTLDEGQDPARPADPDGPSVLRVPYRVPFPGKGKASRLLTRLMSYPEPQIWWARACIRRLVPLLREQHFDVLLVTTPPHAGQWIGIRLRERTGIPYVADLRDDWVTNSRLRQHTPLHAWSARRMERRMVRRADRTVLNTPAVGERFAKRHADLADKFEVITNGYDEEDYATAPPASADAGEAGKLTILYAGGNYAGWLAGQLDDLCGGLESAGLSESCRLITAGEEMPLAARHPKLWRHLGMLSPAEVSSLTRQADLLLLPMPPGEEAPSGTVPLKTYGYLRTGRAVVYLGEAGATTDLLGQFKGTFCLGREGWAGLAGWIGANRETLKQTFSRPGVERYGFDHLAERMEAVLQEAVSAKGA